MKKLIFSFMLTAIIVLVLASCNFTSTPEAPVIQPTQTLIAGVTIELVVQADDTAIYNTVGQVVTYYYNIKNTGTAATPGPVTTTGTTLTCPEINTIVGSNLDSLLDPNETLVCTATYTLTQADIDLGSFTNIAMVTVNGVNSNQVSTTLTTTKSASLILTKTVLPETYNKVDEKIIYTYSIKNNGSTTLGPAQFTVSDAGLSTPVNCGEPTLTLAPNATVSCSVTYTVTQADMAAASIATSATASGGGATTSQPASATVTKNTSTTPPSNLTAGSTVQHKVVAGEWLWQIARCYGADPKKVSAANSQLSNPAQISPDTTVTVPNIGSNGKIYGPPCVGTHTVQSGDTWNSIAQKYNADVTVLQMVNKNTIAVGKVLKVPLNSAGSSAYTPGTATGTCVDLTRSLKFSGLNANTTHFNLCGAMNSAGKMIIGTIEIEQRQEDVGLGGLLQYIVVPETIETSTNVNDANSLIVEDMNYDGNDDFRIVRDLPAGPNIPYLYYLYDPNSKKFTYNEAYGKITSPEFPGNAEIRSKWRESAAKWGIDTYVISNNNPVLTNREIWEAINDTQAKHLIAIFNADGTNTITLNEVVPIPLQ